MSIAPERAENEAVHSGNETNNGGISGERRNIRCRVHHRGIQIKDQASMRWTVFDVPDDAEIAYSCLVMYDARDGSPSK